jgi:hypothetical protein
MSADVYSNGTADGGKQIGGLQLLVADDPTLGTVGGIDRSTNAFWRNQVYDFGDKGIVSGKDTITSAMNEMYLACTRNNDSPDLIIADNTYFQYYWESLQAQQRFTSEKSAAAGFTSLKFMNSDVIFDGGQNGAAPADHMYFLNTNYICFRPHKDRNFVPLEPERFATNQDAMVKLMAWAGNMTLSNGSLQGVIHE